MNGPKRDFIGNSTVLEALFSQYTRGTYAYTENEVSVNLEQDKHDALAETERVLTGDALAMTSGIEAIGHFLSAADLKGVGVSDDQFRNLGFLLSYLGKSLASHEHVIGLINDSLSKARVSS